MRTIAVYWQAGSPHMNVSLHNKGRHGTDAEQQMRQNEDMDVQFEFIAQMCIF
jgi:hypothetical protein